LVAGLFTRSDEGLQHYGLDRYTFRK